MLERHEESEQKVEAAQPESVEAEAPAAPESAVEYEETFVTLSPGQEVQGTVVLVGADEVMVDVGHKFEGRILAKDLGLKSGESPQDVVSVGDQITVHVLRVEDAEGNVYLSKRLADQRAAWERLERAKEAGETIEAKVTERVKGGLLADVGVRGFIPASHVSRNYVDDLDAYVGRTLQLKVIEIEKQKNNVVLSHKEYLEEEYAKAKAEAFEGLKEGTVVDGVVRRITDFGAFVDIGGGVEGLLHVSEMAWSRVKHPSDVVSEGQELKVKVLKIDPEQERISLSLKETLPDPWESISEKYRPGESVQGEVTRVVDFGAFVKLEDGVEGLVHVSQLSDEHVSNPSEVVQPGDAVTVRIVSVDPEKRRIGLSMRQGGNEGRDSGRGRSKENRQPARTTSGEAPAVTLGEMFEDLSTYFAEAVENDEADQADETGDAGERVGASETGEAGANVEASETSDGGEQVEAGEAEAADESDEDEE